MMASCTGEVVETEPFIRGPRLERQFVPVAVVIPVLSGLLVVSEAEVGVGVIVEDWRVDP